MIPPKKTGFSMMIENIDRFFCDLQAVVKDVALSLPHFLDFGLCPTMERPKARKKNIFFWTKKKAAQNGRLLGVVFGHFLVEKIPEVLRFTAAN